MLNNIAGLLSAGGGVANSYESIMTVPVSSSTASVSFTSIPSTYKHLQIRAITKVVSAGTGGAALFMRFNSDSGNNYAIHQLYGNGSSAAAAADSSVSYAFVGNNGGYQSLTTGDGASMFSAHVIDILDYANTSKYKTVRALHGRENNSTTGRIMLESGLWQNTSAVSDIAFTMRDGSGASNIAQYSHFALYGIKG